MLGCIEPSPKRIDNNLQQYTAGFDKQVELLVKAEKALQNAVGQFSHLKRVVPGSHWQNRSGQEYIPGDDGVITRK